MLPPVFAQWFAARGWQPRAHQLALLDHAGRGESVLLVAPTGGGKTLAGFLPSLIDLSGPPPKRAPQKRIAPKSAHALHLAAGKPWRWTWRATWRRPLPRWICRSTVQTRTGDTPVARRQRQRYVPPDILLTTPEQLALLIAHSSAEKLFEGLKTVVLDELHALYNSKRGDLLALGLARLATLAPGHRRVGLSATVKDPSGPLQRFLVPQTTGATAALVVAKGGAAPQISRSASPTPMSPGRDTWRAMPWAM